MRPLIEGGVQSNKYGNNRTLHRRTYMKGFEFSHFNLTIVTPIAVRILKGPYHNLSSPASFFKQAGYFLVLL